MSLIEDRPRVVAEEPPVEPHAQGGGGGLLDWLTTTNHKKIGLLYIGTTFTFFLVGGILALFIRTELANPGLDLLSKNAYNQFFTIHGTVMIFLFIAPMGLGLANYFIPLQIGAPDMAYPRLNALSYWMFLGGGSVILASFLTPGGAASTGWTFYVPLSNTQGSPGAGADLWIMGVLLVSTSSILTGVNLMATIFMLRAPGMTMWRLPLFGWNMIVTSLLILVAFPPLTAGLALLFIDRHFGGHFFDPANGGSVVLFQHLFWFFGHPEVYIMILPFFGIVTDVVATFSRKPIFGYAGFVLASFAIAGLSMGVWAHHMFTTGAVSNPFFSLMSFLIAVPTGIKFFNWIGTMWRGSIWLTVPMLYCIGFMLNFLVGGVTGVMIASPPFDYAVHDTYFIVAHLHYVLAGGSYFAIVAGLTYWFPKMFGYMLNQRLGRIAFAFEFIGFNLTFWPQHLLGLRGMQRRIPDYSPSLGWDSLNFLSTIGSYLFAFGVLLVIVDFAMAFKKKIPAGNDPWGGYTLEWFTSSPPPEHNFHSLPPIRSERPVFDWRHRHERVGEEKTTQVKT